VYVALLKEGIPPILSKWPDSRTFINQYQGTFSQTYVAGAGLTESGIRRSLPPSRNTHFWATHVWTSSSGSPYDHWLRYEVFEFPFFHLVVFLLSCPSRARHKTSKLTSSYNHGSITKVMVSIHKFSSENASVNLKIINLPLRERKALSEKMPPLS